MKFMNDVRDGNDDDIQRHESRNESRLGMRFDSKSQLKKAITLWSVAQNREFKVCESRINTWAARCTEAKNTIVHGMFVPFKRKVTCNGKLQGGLVNIIVLGH